MKGMGNGKEFQDMMKGMMKNMSPMMGAMMGKNAKMDMNKVSKELAKNTHKERMLNKLQQRRAQMEGQTQSNFVLEQTNNPNQFVFKGAEPQEKSSAKPQPVNDDWLNEPTPQPSAPKKSGKKGGKNKKK
jgi:ABC-type lipoprotein release transport system permease subunit